MSFYDNARRRARNRKANLRNSKEVIHTDKRGYSRDETQRSDQQKNKRDDAYA